MIDISIIFLGLIIAALIMETIDSGLGMMYGTLLSPILILVGYDAKLVVPAILLSQAIGGFAATYNHNKYKNAEFKISSRDLKVAGFIFAIGIVSVILGAYVGIRLPKIYLQWYIGILCVIMGTIVLLRKKFNFSWKKIGFIGALSAFNKTLCYDDKTEILTKERGWIPFKDLVFEEAINKGETIVTEVASLDKDNNFVWVKPTEIQINPYVGDMIQIKHRTLNLLVTPNHKLYIREQNKKEYEFIDAQNLNYYSYNTMNQVGWDGEEKEWFYIPKVNYKKQCNGQYVEKDRISMDSWLEFLGWFLSEGSTVSNNKDYIVSIKQFKNENVEKIKSCLDKIGYNWNYNETSGNFRIYNKQLWMYLSKLGKCQDKYIPYEFMNLSKRQLNIMLESLLLGDGHRSKDGSINFYSTSEKLAGQVQEIFIKLGNNSSIKIRDRIGASHLKDGKQFVNKKISYVVYKIKSKETPFITKRHVSRVTYNGNVYCCTVPNHLLLVRREGKPIWSGNSGGGYGPIVASGNIASGLEAKKSIGITDFAEAPICLAGFIAWVALKGWVTPPLGLLIPLSVGAFIGGLLGPMLLSKSKSNLLLARIVAALAIVSGVLLIGLGL